MRQEATNTFQDGLNYDLNPLMTPNNVLTDCLNGTFLTFNGDELTLQNDAGNIRIIVPYDNATLYNPSAIYDVNSKVYVIDRNYKIYYEKITEGENDLTNESVWSKCEVKLSDGFYPLGIKEYGGVLYIVSGKKPDNMGEQWISNTVYPKDSIVFNQTTDDKYYYKAKQLNNLALPIESDDYWEYIGVEKDYINSYGEVEFGSYPSPEAMTTTEYPGLVLNKNVYNVNSNSPDNIYTVLYSPQIINNNVFKSGQHITFDSTNLSENVNNISRFVKVGNNIEYVPKFYKIKLLHQLSNGFMDLTDYVWEEFKKTNSFISGSKLFWFQDPSFKFYCPTQYKGKVAISVEIEDLEKFELAEPLSIDFNNSTNSYSVEIKVTAIGKGLVNPTLVHFKIWVEDGDFEYTQDKTIINNLSTFSYMSIGFSENQNKILHYEITPIINSYLDGELPKEYSDKWMIKGSRLLSTEFDAISLKPNKWSCLSPQPKKDIVELILQDYQGRNIDLENNFPEEPWVFLMQGFTPTDPTSQIIRYYTKHPLTKKATMVNTITGDVINQEIPEEIKNYLENTTVELNAPECGTVRITINTNIKLRASSEITILQNGETISVGGPLNIFYADVVIDIPFTITINSPGYNIITYSDTIMAAKTYNFGLIAHIYFNWNKIVTSDVVTGTGMSCTWEDDRVLSWVGLPVIYRTSTNVESEALTLNPSNGVRKATKVISEVKTFVLGEVTLSGLDYLSIDYDNVSSGTSYKQDPVTNIIFKGSYSVIMDPNNTIS